VLFGLPLVATLVATAAQSAASRFNPESAVVLSQEQGKEVLAQCSRQTPVAVQGFWTPDQKTVRQLEDALAPILQAAIDREVAEPTRRQSVGDYYRQYIGFLLDGQHIVYVNGFHELHLRLSSARPDQSVSFWRTHAVNVCDGWTLFFGAEYDTATGHVRNLRFNGRAG
jgi:hypothetical protein